MGSRDHCQFRVPDKRREELFLLSKTIEFGSYALSEVLGVRRSEVRQARVLCIAPYTFVRIEIRRVSGKSCSHDPAMFSKKRSDSLGAVVDVAAIPEDRQRTAELANKKAEELDYVVSTDILVVRQQLKVQPQSLLYGAQRDGADRGDTIAAIPAAVNRCLPARREGSTYDGSEHEA